jgi:hypothetical protein
MKKQRKVVRLLCPECHSDNLAFDGTSTVSTWSEYKEFTKSIETYTCLNCGDTFEKPSESVEKVFEITEPETPEENTFYLPQEEI